MSTEIHPAARAEAACSHRPPCGGCPRFGEPGIAGDARAALDVLAAAHGLPAVSVVCGAKSGFRLRARMAVRGRVGSPKIGLFEPGSHRVVTIPNCRVQHPLINRVAAIVRRALAETGLTCYSDKAGLGLVRYLQVVVERSSQTAQAVIVANSTTPDPLNALFRLIRERLADELHSLWFNSHLEPSNAVLGPYFERWCGPPSVVEHFGGALSSAPAIHYPPGAFGQSNLEIAEDIIVHIRSLIPEGASVAEFYAGVGAIGLSILDRVRELRVNELNPHSLAGLELGVAGLSPADRAKVSIVAGPAAIECGMAASADVVIADPPRKGLDAPLLEYLVTHPPRRIVYVSCGLASLLADTARLTTGSKLKLTALAAFNLMPFTEHVETVALFECEQR